MVRILDYLGDVKPKYEIFRILIKKKPNLARIIASIEKETGIDYPEVHLVYAMILDQTGGYYDAPHGVTTHRFAVNEANSFSEVVYISGFALLMLEKNVLVGVLVEEFLHYLFRTVYLANSKSWKGLPNKQMLEPIKDWFKD